MYNHRLWDNDAFLKSAFTGGFRASGYHQPLPRMAPRYTNPRSAFAATSPYAAFIPANAVHRPAPASLMPVFGRRSPASAMAAAAQASSQRSARTAFQPAVAPLTTHVSAPAAAPKPRLPAYRDMPVTPQTMEIRRNHGPIVPRGID